MTAPSPLLVALTRIVALMDHEVAALVRECDDGGRSWCDRTTQLHHLYIELRQAWLDAGGTDTSPFRLTADGKPLTTLQSNGTLNRQETQAAA